ncbi:hypothetical protein BGX27_009952 [Mortierella sp. AM989]|nr:hypothetical protein BGX27_009952 [Mortierella sp. AM989]
MSTLKVIISSTSHNPHKFTLELNQRCSILELKEIIITRLDTKLTIADQRLIFGGRILDDKDTLEHVFEKVDCSVNSPTIHLAVSSRQYTSSPSPCPSPIQRTPATATPSSSIPTEATATYSFIPSTTPTMNHQNPVSSTNVDGANSARLAATGLGLPMFSPVPLAVPSLNQPMQYAVIKIRARITPCETTAELPDLFPFDTFFNIDYILSHSGMPYLVPAAYLPLLAHQHNLQQLTLSHYGAYMANPDGTTSFQHVPTAALGATPAAAGGPAAPGPEENAQEIAAREQRRAASLWLLMKLAFGVYLFSQNGSIERILLLHIAALIIFLQQTGRLRIVRRIGHLPPADNPQVPAPNAGRATPTVAPARQNTTTTTTTTTTTSFTSSDNDNNVNSRDDNQQPSSSTDTSTYTNGAGGSDNRSASSSSPQSQSATASGAATSATDSLRHRNPQGLVQTQSQDPTEQRQQEQRGSAWRSINHALLTFVTSLIPAPPPPEIDQAVANAAAADRGM